MMKPLAFVDLDDTLCMSKRRLGALGATPHCVAYLDPRGTPGGYCTPAQWGLYTWLKANTIMIPVTARRLHALQRMQLTFDHEQVCCGGGLLLTVDGQIDEVWCGQMAEALAPYAAQLESLEAHWRQLGVDAGCRVRTRVVGHRGVPMYLCAKHMGRDAELFGGLIDAHVETLRPEGWHLYVHNYSAALSPPPLTKGHAVDYLKARHEAPFTLGVGDSAADHPFLARCDVAMTPTDSDLFRHLTDAMTGSTR
ncbi:MAG: hypothetical protein ACE366_02350 [Bradymonadia bacterium]